MSKMSNPVYNNIACYKSEHAHACRHLEGLVEELAKINYQIRFAEEQEELARCRYQNEVARVKETGRWETEEQAEE